jgi:glycerate 2-kinase
MNAPKIIKNRDQLETSELRRKALDIIEAGITRVLPTTIVRAALSFECSQRRLSILQDTYQLAGRLFVIGGGKASGLMAQELENILGYEAITDGLIIEKASPSDFDTRRTQIVQAGHPVPDQRGLEATRRILDLKRRYSINGNDLVLCLISGGASALMTCPLDGISLTDKQEVTRLLLHCGANIQEINTVRKHLSGTKGGRLAEYFAPANVISLILSDVVGNDLSVIASGPTYPDKSTYLDAFRVLQKYFLVDRIPENVKLTLERGCRGQVAETPKSLGNARNYIIGDNRLATEAMAQEARQLGFKALVITSEQTGDTESVARQRAREILGYTYAGYDALIMGGETTPTLPVQPGRGGRNQHYVALTIELLDNYPADWVVASVGTDGSDYLPEVAGAIGDKETLAAIKAREPNFRSRIENFDSHTLLARVDNSLIVTGSTHTNVGDIILYLLQNP